MKNIPWVFLFAVIFFNSCKFNDDPAQCISVLDCGPAGEGWMCVDGACVKESADLDQVSGTDSSNENDSSSLTDDEKEDGATDGSLTDELNDDSGVPDTGADETPDEQTDESSDEISDVIPDETADLSTDETPDETFDDGTPDETADETTVTDGEETPDDDFVSCSTVSKFKNIEAVDLVKAMDICSGVEGTPLLTRADGRNVTCTYQMGCGSEFYQKSVVDVQTAVMEQFGTDSSNAAIKGGTMIALSSGRARDADDTYPTEDDTYEWEAYNAQPPADFTAAHGGSLPTTKTGCKAGEYANDSVMLTVQLKVPATANSFSFNFRFFSQEYKNYTCSQFNDFFIAMLYSGAEGIPEDRNISFDAGGSYISVNSDNFFTVCTPKTGYTCPDGTAGLTGTGYGTTYVDPIGKNGYGGGTKWLTTTAPVVPGETITLKFAIWDTGDTQVDSLVLIDNFRWNLETSTGPVTYECWDTNQNTACDLSEDFNKDGECSERDCYF